MILIIDDIEADLFLMQTVLERAGFEVKTVSDGAEALRMFKENKYDLIITDVIMEFSGINLVEEIRKQDKNLPIIAVTGSLLAAASLLERTMVSETLVKPFDNNKLVETVKTLLTKV